MKLFKTLFFAIIAAITLSSCNNNTDGTKYLPSISGNAGDVLVIINKAQWEGEVGTTIRNILASEYPYLPQREPAFNLYNAPHSEFSGAFLVHRNILIVNISSGIDSAGIKIGENAWAKPQIVITVNAKTPQEASSVLMDNQELIFNSIEQAERKRLITNSKIYEDEKVKEAVIANIGGSPTFPRGFTIKKNTPEFMWISQETTHVNQGILIFKIPYTDQEQLTADYLKTKLNDLWQANVPGMRENSYMIFNKLIEPGFNTITYNGRNMIEVRGLWEVENDFMGGPLVCHIFPDQNRENLIILNGFVYAPKYDKRKYLRQVESIIYSFK